MFDIKQIFASISQTMQNEFESFSSAFLHRGNKGSSSENILSEFLKSKFPDKYGFGNGEIIGHVNNLVSKQIDIVIYNKHEFTPLISNDVGIFPIESIYGTIEVKSKLTKDELLIGLENIKSMKMLAPRDEILISTMPGMVSASERQTPFGIIFGFSLHKNSLDSLLTNLKEWESDNPDKSTWPNLIVILNEGIIYHQGNIDHMHCITSESIIQNSYYPSYCKYEKNTLFQFYTIIFDLCRNTILGPLKLENYAAPFSKVGNYIVRGHDKLKKNNVPEEKFKLSANFINTVYDYCIQNNSRIINRDWLIMSIGQIPLGMENTNNLNQKFYLYNPNKYTFPDNGILQSLFMEINYNHFCIPLNYITDNDIEAH